MILPCPFQYEAYWERLAAYTSTPVLFDDAEPGDVLQGMLGDQMKPLKTFYFVATPGS